VVRAEKMIIHQMRNLFFCSFEGKYADTSLYPLLFLESINYKKKISQLLMWIWSQFPEMNAQYKKSNR